MQIKVKVILQGQKFEYLLSNKIFLFYTHETIFIQPDYNVKVIEAIWRRHYLVTLAKSQGHIWKWKV